jgi:ribonuclease-3
MDHVPQGDKEETPAALAKRLGLPFGNLLLLSRSLTHRSYINEHPEALEDNERLEFLGDAVLDFVSAAWLYNRFPEMKEGELTRMRSALVRTEQLAEFARTLFLGQAMRLGRGEIVARGRNRDVLLCATFEALIGALYLQAGIKAVMEFVHPFLKKAASLLVLEPDTFDPKSRLQEWSQSEHFGIPEYITVEASGPDHERQFEVEVRIKGEFYGRGSGHSKATAARAAAQEALNLVNQRPTSSN